MIRARPAGTTPHCSGRKAWAAGRSCSRSTACAGRAPSLPVYVSGARPLHGIRPRLRSRQTACGRETSRRDLHVKSEKWRLFKMRHLQRVDGHARPVLDLDGCVGGGRGALLVVGGNTDGDYQTTRQNPVISRVDRDDDGRCCAHGLAWVGLGHTSCWGQYSVNWYQVCYLDCAYMGVTIIL